MLKYYFKVINKLLYFNLFTFLAIMMFVPLAALFAILKSSSILIAYSFLCYLTAFFLVFIFNPAGASPLFLSTIENEMIQRDNDQETYGTYDMTCLLPVKRKDYVKYSLYALCINGVIQSGIILYTIFSKTEIPQTSTFLTLSYPLLMLSAPGNSFFWNTRVNRTAHKAQCFFILLTIAFFTVVISGNTEIIPVIPAALKIVIVILTAVYLAILGYISVFKGEYARNGERIRN